MLIFFFFFRIILIFPWAFNQSRIAKGHCTYPSGIMPFNKRDETYLSCYYSWYFRFFKLLFKAKHALALNLTNA